MQKICKFLNKTAINSYHCGGQVVECLSDKPRQINVPKTVLGSTEQMPASIRLLNSRNLLYSFCSRDRALA